MDNSGTDAGNDATGAYILSPDDTTIISATKTLLWKIARCELTTPAQLEAIARGHASLRRPTKCKVRN